MDPEDLLNAGMSVDDVCAALTGWDVRRARTPIDGRFHAWDFVEPGTGRTIRATFEGTCLWAWGKPQDAPPRRGKPQA